MNHSRAIVNELYYTSLYVHCVNTRAELHYLVTHAARLRLERCFTRFVG
jgi:uncharacterized membrane protein YebE (DUF533 family)